ncbi:unnamed protein product [Fraxinus pennsylvanica]|uniref:Phylloplanin n=1 Tax=Fraxinus pennsylvanica TaxID=56036 RepID=A0AAD2A4W1_9LAMI|nr:unnamed protein product [Fraxinus pennsylvanica]
MALSIADATTVTASINGTLFCTVNGSLGVNGSATPVFPNALVQLQCGGGNTVVASATTNSAGMFAINLNFNILGPSPVTLANLLGGRCRLRVATPLVSCNSTLPPGNLVSAPLRLIVTASNGLIIIFRFGTTGFTLTASN